MSSQSSRAVVLSIDQGTTGTRAILYNSKAKRVASAYQEFSQYYPKPGWVEHDALEIWKVTQSVIRLALKKARRSASQIVTIGITNQRETVVIWDKTTGRPVHRAIVWQDRRTADFCDALKRKGKEKIIRTKTGLVIDPYFSATKVRWLLDHVRGLRSKAQQGKVLFGTIDSWLLWKFTNGQSHATDFTNASRTLLYNIKTKSWDAQLLKLFKIPSRILPKVQNSGSLFGKTAAIKPLVKGVPIHSMIGDQQAALYGQGCYRPGQIKNTYGTGCFVVLNLGKKMPKPPHGLLTTLACDQKGKSVYALEGSIFIGGAAVQWLRDGLELFKHAKDTEKLIRGLKDTEGVVMIPAFVGLGSPYWNAHARGVIAGITRGTKRSHIIRATLESMAHQTADVIEAMRKVCKVSIRELKVDGGATQNRFLMQFQANVLEIPILVSEVPESTAWGAAKLAAQTAGFWASLEGVDRRVRYKKYRHMLRFKKVSNSRETWKREIQRLLA